MLSPFYTTLCFENMLESAIGMIILHLWQEICAETSCLWFYCVGKDPWNAAGESLGKNLIEIL